MNVSYTGLIESKSSRLIPQKDGLALHSRYDPQKEAKAFADSFNDDSLFFIIGGLAGGYHIEALLKNNPNRKIIAVENCKEDFDFLYKIPCCKELKNNSQVIFTTPEKLFETIINSYIPSAFGKFTVTFLRAWENAFPSTANVIKEIAKKTEELSIRDFLTQRAFGKIWQKNIIDNLRILEKLKKVELNQSALLKKTAAIIAAGPTLDQKISILKEKRDDFFIICADTSYQVLLSSGIKSDAVVSLDGQMISYCHFIKTNRTNIEGTIFLFDLCAQTSTVRHIQSLGGKIIFFSSAHPLSSLAGYFLQKSNFIRLDSGSGTVTIAAADFAYKLGFSKVEFFGADFAYKNGKPYTKGTYLDLLYSKNQNKLETAETKFCSLMFRTPLIKLDKNSYTNALMESYKNALGYYLKNPASKLCVDFFPMSAKTFLKNLHDELLSFPNDFFKALLNPHIATILPLMAYYEKYYSIQQSYELALKKTLEYTIIS